MKKKLFITIVAIVIVGISTSVMAITANDSQIQQQKSNQYLQEFDNFQLKTNFTSRDEVVVELKRLGSAYKNAVAAHSNDETGKKIIEKYQTMTNQLKAELAKFPPQSLTLEEQMNAQISSWKDEVAYNNASEYPADHANAEYALNEAQGIYNQYKQGKISAQVAWDRMSKVKVTDRQNGISN